MLIDEAKKDRTVLKGYFVKNAIPTEGEFAQFIDSGLNQREDGVVKPAGDPLSLEATGPADDSNFKKVLNFYYKFSDANPAWTVSLRPRGKPADPATGRLGFSMNDGSGNSRLFVDAATGNVGIGTVSPSAKLEVAGEGGKTVDLVVNGQIRSQGAEGGLWVATNRFVGGLNADKIGFFNGEWRVLVLPDGKVGVGTAAPTERLHVATRARFDNMIVGAWPASANYMMVGTSELDQTNQGNYALLQSAAGADKGHTYLNSPAALHLRIANGQQDRITIANNGNVGVGCSDPRFVLDVGGRMRVRQSDTPNTAGVWFSTYGNGQQDNAFVGMANANEVGFWGTPGGRFHLTVDVTSGLLKLASPNAQKPGGGAWAQLSDERLKTNIQPLRGALDKLLALEGVTYEWRKPEEQGHLAGPQMGMIAQQVEDVCPEWVTVGSDGYRVLSIRGFEALAVEAIRELHAKVEALTARCARYERLLAERHIALETSAGGS